MRYLVIAYIICCVQFATAQIRIIPRDKVLETANPMMVQSPLRITTDSVNFGTIDEMSGVWQGRTELVNTGDDTIALTQIKSTCGCLRAEVPQRFVLPKSKIELNLRYYPRGHAGNVFQRVFIYTNYSQSQPSAILQLRGVVTASADRSDDYPYARGVLRLRQEQITLGATAEVQRIACMNGGSIELEPKVDTMLLPQGVKVYFEPAKLAPKGEGDMVIKYLPQSGEGGINGGKIYIKGVGVPPRQSCIEIEIKK